nr:hypothetical protein [Tanacetum cinerariifolium]
FVRVEDEVPVVAAEKAKGSRKKRKTAGGASGSTYPSKKLREDHDTSSDVGASTGGMYLVVIQELFERSNLNIEHPVERFVVLSYPPCHSSSNVVDAEVSSIAMSRILDPPIMTTAVATTVAANISSIPVPRASDELVHA